MLDRPPFQPAPDRGQLAVSGVWETAFRFSAADPPDEATVGAFLAGGREVAFEAFFGRAFFGFRRTGDAAELVRLTTRCGRALRDAASGSAFFQAIGEITQLPLGTRLRFAEIGAVDAWRSVGAFRIEDPGSARADLDSIWERVLGCAVGQNRTHPKAIEFGYDNADGTTHWFALSISSNAPPFELRRDLLDKALGLI